jgi:peptidoglycan/xylan/chitin deacetylase (PgdA/CDA1 family)
VTALPKYYTALSPFRETFLSGNPILTYHHIARPRRGARIKGLYVAPALFEQQLSELRAAGFASASLETLSTRDRMGRPVSLTFDDGFRDVLESGLPVLKKHGFNSVLFLVCELLGKTNEWQQRVDDVTEPLMTEVEVCEWLNAGQQIGSHTLSHPRLTQIPLAVAREEITSSKKKLEDRFGVEVRHFCYPYGDLNESIRALVVEAGYRTACTTVTGINAPAADPFTLKRFTARYASRNWANLWAGIAKKLVSKTT